MGIFSRKKQTIGYKVKLGLHAILCHGPIDKLTRITFGDKVAWDGENSGGSITISQPKLFGGEESEGGVEGTIDVEMGTNSQGRNDYLQGQLGTDIPAFRGVVGLVFRHFYFGMGKYLKRFAFRGVRIQNLTDGSPQWYASKADVGGDLNPAHIIRECLTNADWGMGYNSATDVDDVSFTAAADQLHSEGMGISLLWDRSTEIQEFIESIIKHIDGALYVEPKTGKFTLTLVRDDFVLEELPVFDDSNVVKISRFKRRTIDELTNAVSVKYWNKETGNDGSVTVQNIALAARQEATMSTSRDYPGFTNGEIATKVAMRDLKALSNPLASAEIYLNRQGFNLRPGSAFVLNYPRYGVDQLVMRVLDIEFGKLDSGQIRINAAEDVFALGDSVYSPPPSSGWEKPDSTALPSPHRVMREATFGELVDLLGSTEAQALDPATGMVLVAGTADGLAISADLFMDTGAGHTLVEAMDFSPTAILSSGVGADTTTFPLSGGKGLDSVVVGTSGEINGEIVEVVSITGSAAEVRRGIMDTAPPDEHPAGSRIFFAGEFYATDERLYTTAETAKAKIRTITGGDELDLASAPEDTLQPTGRHVAPYPPGRLQIDGSVVPSSMVGNIPLDWRHRDRIAQGADPVSWLDAVDYGPEAGTTYTAEFYNEESGDLIHTESGITGKSFNYLESDEFLATSTVASLVRVELYAVRDGIESRRIIRIFDRLPTLISVGEDLEWSTPGSAVFDGTTGIEVIT